MKFVMFYHSLISDWNHGNAHFLRGVVRELLVRGHEVEVYEPREGWSLTNLKQEHGPTAIQEFHSNFPELMTNFYQPGTLKLDQVVADADIVIVHEWSDHQLVRNLGRCRSRSDHFRLLFHDTHHRCVTDPASIASYDLTHYDGVLAYGRAIRDIYLQRDWIAQAWVWHEAADTRLFRPLPRDRSEGDVVWIGNWGDGERTAEIEEFLLSPIRTLKVQARCFGVRYPREAIEALASAGIQYGGWLANHKVPETFARYRATLHIPRRPYRELLPGIPTIRVFEALACGIPMISAPWDDVEHLFTPGEDFLVARNGLEMTEQLRTLLSDTDLSTSLAERGRRTILARHTCRHRVDELLSICHEIGVGANRNEQLRKQKVRPQRKSPEALA